MWKRIRPKRYEKRKGVGGPEPLWGDSFLEGGRVLPLVLNFPGIGHLTVVSVGDRGRTRRVSREKSPCRVQSEGIMFLCL
ncbi:hypothetical protein AKJ39_02840 [candidate division MSBL1 archaeon SCGC-AAA259J03]|uniref:Uncharacterized protein n=1 Tax=candidate division MSBL1 archaeon SCGC-AAA259J03 TaxID=1698269 RepID=A0A656YW11_9EURY|nr:hypothetical protein AKJ39_02840 [candidate division MSBL1 archaeon SCGC-AAA259J03]